jgi:N-methylhydantoinase A
MPMRTSSTPRRRLAFDTGGTFTDLTIDGSIVFKSPTTPHDPVEGVLAVCDVAAKHLEISRRDLLSSAQQVVYGTTRATNAVIAGDTARTALLVTMGHPDILLWREGGRVGTFDFSVPFPEPYIPRRLTFEITERIGPRGEVVVELDEERTIDMLHQLRTLEVEAIAVCLLWSIVNPRHEQRVGELIRQHLPGVPFTLAHELNPTIREYRRASAAAIDASLKPLMANFLRSLAQRLREEGFAGRVLVMTSGGGVLDADSVAEAPIHTLASGPAATPVAGRHFLSAADAGVTAIITDAGGTSFDVSLVRRGRIPSTRETRIGRSHYGPMTGFPSIDVKSVGAGGGSIAWLDGTILRVGPQSAGAAPGPACYGLGGTQPTVTDACVSLGYLDPGRFLGGRMQIDRALGERALLDHVAAPLDMDLHEAAAAVVAVASERMINAIEDVAVNQGVDPRGATMVCGGGSGGFYACAIGRRLGCGQLIVPESAAALSAVGVFLSDLIAEFVLTLPASTAAFPREEVNRTLAALTDRCETFIAAQGQDAVRADISYSVEARYPQQLWDLEVPLAVSRFDRPEDVEGLREAFHRVHHEVLGIADPAAPVEVTAWRARARCDLGVDVAHDATPQPDAFETEPTATRTVYFSDTGWVQAGVYERAALGAGARIVGPAIVESGLTTFVLEPEASASVLASGSMSVIPS